QLALDPAGSGDLREDAMFFVCRLGGDDHLRELETPIGEAPASTDIDDRIRGVLILELLNRGIWPAWRASRHAPTAAPHLVDHRRMLLHQIEGQLTIEDARRLLPHFREL